MSKEIWLSVEEVCELTGEVKETVRRKCKREEYYRFTGQIHQKVIENYSL